MAEGVVGAGAAACAAVTVARADWAAAVFACGAAAEGGGSALCAYRSRLNKGACPGIDTFCVLPLFRHVSNGHQKVQFTCSGGGHATTHGGSAINRARTHTCMAGTSSMVCRAPIDDACPAHDSSGTATGGASAGRSTSPHSCHGSSSGRRKSRRSACATTSSWSAVAAAVTRRQLRRSQRCMAVAEGAACEVAHLCIVGCSSC
jgi:hypothetical protein